VSAEARAGGDAPALDFEGVGVELGGREILRDVSLALRPGEVLGLTGPNGAGKTTLLRVASRVLRPARGRVRLGGRLLEDLSRRALARALAVVPQNTQVAFPFRVAEVVLMGRAPHLAAWSFEGAADLERAREAMESVGVEELADRSVLEISGGERQLVLIARALTQDPRVLLLDEPTSHLDLHHRLRVLERIREFARGDRAALVVSHDLALAASGCDRLALLDAGRVLALGEPAEVLTPSNLRRAYRIEADVLAGPDGAPLVVPRSTAG
jgi:iron complex transport system ATP-binding protein